MPKIKPWVSPGAQGVFPIPEEYVEIVDVKQELDSELKEPAPEDDSINH